MCLFNFDINILGLLFEREFPSFLFFVPAFVVVLFLGRSIHLFETSMASSSSSSSPSSSDGTSFHCFCLHEDGFCRRELEVLPVVDGESCVSAASFRNSISKEHLQALALRFFVPADRELIVPSSHDTVMHPPIGCCTVYIDHLKAGLRLPLFSFLVEVLIYYKFSLSQLVPNAIRTLLAF